MFTFEETLTRLAALRDELCTLAAKAEGYWYNLANDYQSKYAFSSDYDKSYKQTYYEKARGSNRVATALENLELPPAPENVMAFVEAVETEITAFPRLVTTQQEMQTLVDKMQELSEHCAESGAAQVINSMTASRSQPIDVIPASFCKDLQYFFTDIDDTMTHDGLLPANAYQAIWKLSEHGIHVVPVTGRPAGWCDHFARMWPVQGVIGENGAFYFAYDRSRNRVKRVYLLTEAERLEGQQRLETIRARVLKEVPGCQISADQPYRITDLAIDFCEDVEPLSKKELRHICEIAEEEGATYKISSIHVNCWYGDHDKVSCLKRFLRDFTDQSFEAVQSSMVFAGDSPNDEPMFQELAHSIAVANIRNFLCDLQHHPTYITTHEAADGFCEAVEVILRKRALGVQK